MVKCYTGEQLIRFKVKPGVTGLVQCSGRNNLTVLQQIDADVEYVQRQSLLFDVKILFRTIWAVLRGEGAD
jgi:lipopolysaccharide/colanic/teichoic acid biosynthesis glycosyltransferase